MARTRLPDRLETICEAALRVFIEQGYRRARIDEIARRAAVSPGTVYLYVESKEALFLLILRWLSLRGVLPTELPVPTPKPGEAVAGLRKGLAIWTHLPVFEAAIGRPKAESITAELAAIVDELYQMLYDNRDLIALMESCAHDWPEFYDLYVGRVLPAAFRRIGDYVESRISAGQIAPVEDIAITVRFIVESISWFARSGNADHSDLANKGAAVISCSLQSLIGRALTTS